MKSKGKLEHTLKTYVHKTKKKWPTKKKVPRYGL